MQNTYGRKQVNGKFTIKFLIRKRTRPNPELKQYKVIKKKRN